MTSNRALTGNLLFPCLFFASTGGAFWAVARSSGEACAWSVGLMWGLGWYCLSLAQGNAHKRYFGSVWIVPAFVVGMYYGGQHGYGQFHSWVLGIFHLYSKENRTVPINPATGYWWNFLCGAGWGGVAAVFVAWTGRCKALNWWQWVLRIAFVMVLAWGFQNFAIIRPGAIMPLYDRVNYGDALSCPDCTRTTRTLVESMMWIGFVLGGILFELLRRDYRNAAFIVLMGLGFGLAFTVFEWLHTLPDIAGAKINWWKYWETSVGTLGGVTLGVLFYIFNRPDPASSTDPLPPTQLRWHYVAALWLPTVYSFLKVFQEELSRVLQYLGINPETSRSTLLNLLAIGLFAAGAVSAIVWGWRPAEFGLFRVPATMFVIVYVVMFLISYVPKFEKHGGLDSPANLVQISVYGLWFVTGLACFTVLCRTRETVGPTCTANSNS